MMMAKQGGMEDGRRPLVLQGAMTVETQDMVAALTEVQEGPLGHYRCVRGLLAGYPVIVCETQWGMANAAAVTALVIERYHPCAVISQGTAGAHNPALHNYDIVLGARTVNESAWQSQYAPQGAGIDPRALKQLGVFAWNEQAGAFTQEVYHQGDAALLAAAQRGAADYQQGRVVTGTIGTCDSWNCEVDRILFLREFYGSDVEEMESDAVAQICLNFAVPFLALRIVSNSVFQGDEDWDLAVGPVCQQYTLQVARAYLSQRGDKQAGTEPVESKGQQANV